jgi:hypothetical protein
LSLAVFTLVLSALALPALARQSPPPPAPNASQRALGTIKSVGANRLVLSSDSGAEINVTLPDGIRMLRTAPGKKDLAGATAIQLSDLKVGDRILVRGTSSADGRSLLASAAIVMNSADIAQKQERDREDWQKRGLGGLVKSVDPASGTITISLASFSASKTFVVNTTKTTVVRRYAPNSVKFDDATPATLDEIKPGDQLRARGVRSPDGGQMEAEEIVAGSFRNIAGTVVLADPTADTLTIADLATKHPVIVRITSDSQLHQLPPYMALRLAMRLKGGGGDGAGANGGGGGGSRGGSRATAEDASGRTGEGGPPGQPGGRSGGASDLQQILGRMPSVQLADLRKGDAVMDVATEGTPTIDPTAIVLLSGVEPILTASPTSGSAASLLSPWNLGSTAGADAGTP